MKIEDIAVLTVISYQLSRSGILCPCKQLRVLTDNFSASDGVGAEFSDEPFSEHRGLGADVRVTVANVNDVDANVRPITTVPILDVVVAAVQIPEVLERDGRLSAATSLADSLKSYLGFDAENDEVVNVTS